MFPINNVKLRLVIGFPFGLFLHNNFGPSNLRPETTVEPFPLMQRAHRTTKSEAQPQQLLTELWRCRLPLLPSSFRSHRIQPRRARVVQVRRRHHRHRIHNAGGGASEQRNGKRSALTTNRSDERALVSSSRILCQLAVVVDTNANKRRVRVSVRQPERETGVVHITYEI